MPQVDSAVIRLDVRKQPPVSLTDEKLIFEVVKAGFSMRRKTLQNTLAGLRGLTKARAGVLLTEAGINPIRRAETLDLEEFARLSNLIAEEIRT